MGEGTSFASIPAAVDRIPVPATPYPVVSTTQKGGGHDGATGHSEQEDDNLAGIPLL